MSDFLQMDIFFFITSVVLLILLFVVTLVGIYIILIVRKVKNIIKELEIFVKKATTSGLDSVDFLKAKVEETLNKGGLIERAIISILGTILAKSFKKRDKIKKDAPKK